MLAGANPHLEGTCSRHTAKACSPNTEQVHKSLEQGWKWDIQQFVPVSQGSHQNANTTASYFCLLRHTTLIYVEPQNLS